MTQVITGDAFFKALTAAGIFRDGERVRRVVIDARTGHALVIHVERYGDERLLSVVATLDGVEVSESPRCTAQYERPGGREPDDRVVRCHLQAGHPGPHEEADTEITWTAR